MKFFQIKKITFTTCSIVALFVLSFSSAHAVFISEIHYDNMNADVGEGVEVTGVAGENLSGWSLLFYNGNNGSVYKNYALSGVFTDMQEGMGVLEFEISGIQNGGSNPDGIALVNDMGSVLQFLSYEGSLTASSGAAMGLLSTDIGVAESGATPVGKSLQLMGNGRDYVDFFWGEAAASFGGINGGQTFSASTGRAVISVPEPASGALLLFGLLLLALMRELKNITVPALPV